MSALLLLGLLVVAFVIGIVLVKSVLSMLFTLLVLLVVVAIPAGILYFHFTSEKNSNLNKIRANPLVASSLGEFSSEIAKLEKYQDSVAATRLPILIDRQNRLEERMDSLCNTFADAVESGDKKSQESLSRDIDSVVAEVKEMNISSGHIDPVSESSTSPKDQGESMPSAADEAEKTLREFEKSLTDGKNSSEVG